MFVMIQIIQSLWFLTTHYDCEKQHNLRQFNLLKVKPCTEASSNIQHAKVRAFMFELELNPLIFSKVKLMVRKLFSRLS